MTHDVNTQTGIPQSLRRYDIAPGGCWIFRKRNSNGYAINTSYRGRKANAYKLIWEIVNDQQVPDGMVLDHLCDNGQGGCVNPNHLRVCTQAENVMRSETTIPGRNIRKTHCLRGHPLSGDNLLLQRDGKQRRCKQCFLDHNKRWRDEHRERARELQRKYDSTPEGKAKKAERQKRYRERKRAEREAS